MFPFHFCIYFKIASRQEKWCLQVAGVEYWPHDTHLLSETFLLFTGHFSYFAFILLDPNIEDGIQALYHQFKRF